MSLVIGFQYRKVKLPTLIWLPATSQFYCKFLAGNVDAKIFAKTLDKCPKPA
jgi:hypothetical protein